jgi:hypothetical protein
MRNALLAALVATALPGAAAGQTKPDQARSPFLVGAATAGMIGFTGGREAGPLVGGYGYAAFSRMIVGLQVASALRGGQGSDDAYATATLAYPARAIRRSLVYPFVALGAGTLPDASGTRDRAMVVGAGVGADRVWGEGGPGAMMGFRAGYLSRRGDAGERAVFLNLAFGAGGRRVRAEPPSPPVIVAGR